MREPVAVVMAMKMLRLDGYGRVWGSLGSPQLKKFYCLDLSFCTRTGVFLIHFKLG